MVVAALPSTLPPAPGPTAGESVPSTVYKIPREVVLAYNSKKRIGNYLIGKTIGEGAFAKVKEGLHVLTGEKVAIKIIDKSKARQDSYLWKNLKREVKLLQCLRHPNVVRLYESLETEVAFYLILELVRGGEMKDHISKNERLSEAQSKRFVRQLVSAVWHLHSAGVVHRDLKVENIMLDRAGDLKIIDFGLSNTLKSLQAKAGMGTQCGSPAYAAPELLANKGYDFRVDIWAIGINMFAMLVGKLPFKVRPFNLKKLYQKMVAGDMEALPPGTSPDARDLLQRLLQPDPKDRISLRDCVAHQWMGGGIELIDSPNMTTSEELNQEVLGYMSEFHSTNVHSLSLDILTHSATPHTATYHYLCRKFDRYLAEQDKASKTSISTTTSTPSSTRKTSQPKRSKVLKRRPKTATIALRHSADADHSTAKPAAARRFSVSTSKPRAADSENITPEVLAKEAFRTPLPVTAPECVSRETTNDSGFSGSRKMSVISCRTSTPEPSYQTKGTAVRGGQVAARRETERDGKVNWRHTSLLKTRYTVNNSAPSSTISSVSGRVNGSSRLSTNIVSLHRPSAYSVSTAGNRAPANQWPNMPVRSSAIRAAPSTSAARGSGSVLPSDYRWRNELMRAKVGVTDKTHVFRRNISFPEHAFSRPQPFRAYSYR